MEGSTHAAVGIATAIGTGAGLGLIKVEGTDDWRMLVAKLGTLTVIGWTAGQLPDLDQPTSTVANSGKALGKTIRRVGGIRRHSLLGLVVGLAAWAVNLLPQSLAWCANTFFGGHRGLVHTLPATAFVAILAGYVSRTGLGLSSSWGLVVGACYLSHLVIDSFTLSGVMWFWPYSRKSFHLLPKQLRFRSSGGWQNLTGQLTAFSLSLVLLLMMMLAHR